MPRELIGEQSRDVTMKHSSHYKEDKQCTPPTFLRSRRLYRLRKVIASVAKEGRLVASTCWDSKTDKDGVSIRIPNLVLWLLAATSGFPYHGTRLGYSASRAITVTSVT